jgi:hypothetical protein
MDIDASDAQFRKAPVLRRNNLEPYSKVAVEREEQPTKHRSQSCSTERGMDIDESETQH